ncbi:hypothetical protein EMPG_12663 [Blastomyces silverae]|uniref:Uncharacterized protein n=1 Tax=Blastomyces silverae TaxID=2060906 RepID=A0A0H1BMB0_9EURO|nr:hypothetical protein EMPG_12663 [Blastomyces silverae]
MLENNKKHKEEFINETHHLSEIVLKEVEIIIAILSQIEVQLVNINIHSDIVIINKVIKTAEVKLFSFLIYINSKTILLINNKHQLHSIILLSDKDNDFRMQV